MLLLLIVACQHGVIELGTTSVADPTTTVDSGTTAETIPPTPGEVKVSFDPPSQTFDTSLTVTISAGDGTAYYTTDGSVPDSDSKQLTGPITLSDSSEIRVLATNSAGDQDYGAASYLKVSADAADFDSNLPLVVLYSEQSLPSSDGGDYVGISLQIHDVGEDGRAHLVGEATDAERAGLRIRGSSTASDPKHSYALETRGVTDDLDHKAALLGMPADSDWVLYAPLDFDRAFMRNALMYQLSNEAGRYAPRTRFVEVFEAERGKSVSSDGYVGIYVLIERIGRSPDRVNVQAIGDQDLLPPEVTGGYIFKRDRTGDGENGFNAGRADGTFEFDDPLVYVYPKEETIARAQANWLSDDIDAFADALAAPGGNNPSDGTHYTSYIDQDSWIDHHILNTFPKNPDALRLSGYLYKDREGPIVAGPLWDFDRSLGCADDERSGDPTWWDATNITWDTTDMFHYGWYEPMFQDSDFTTPYWARWKVLLAGTLSVSHVEEVIDTMAAQLEEAAPRNYERWSSYPPRGGSFDSEVALLKDWIEKRHAWISGCLNTHPNDPMSCTGD